MQKKFWWTLAACVIVAAGCAPKEGGDAGAPAGGDDAGSAAAPAAAEVTFASAVQPIIAARCNTCHVDETKGGLSLASLETALAGGKNGAVVSAGDADGSKLYQMVAGLAEKRMPPKGDPLSDAEIATIKSWIDGGAK